MSNIKYLLVALSTTRTVEGEQKRVRFPAKSTVDLTADELKLLDKLTVSTGKLHYRDPVNESPQVSEPIVDENDGDAFDGESVAMDKKTVAQLKAYLDHNEVSYDDGANKADLLAAAQAHAADPDGGL